MTKGVPLVKEGKSNRKGEVAIAGAIESSQLYEKLSMAGEPDSAATARETSIEATGKMC